MRQRHEVSPIPPGAYLEVDATLVDEGKMMKKLNHTLRSAFAEWMKYQGETGDRKSGCAVTVQITMTRIPNTDKHIDVSYKIAKKIPQAVSHSTARASEEKLLCEPIGTFKGDPDQTVMFDGQGRAIAKLDTHTGVVSEMLSSEQTVTDDPPTQEPAAVTPMRVAQ